MKKYLFLLLLSLTGSSASAQAGLTDLFTKCFEIVNEKSGKERFKGQILKGKRNGMGSMLTKKGMVYIGDFYRDKMTGMGMMIASDESFVDNCEGCVVYVGNWKDGIKSGFGKCYDIDGNMIYKGQFSEGKPTGSFPSNSPIDDNRQLSLQDFGNNTIFLGEAINDIPNGVGVVIYPDGAFWFHTFKNDVPKGIGLYATRNGEWQTLKWENGEAVAISSSEYYKQVDYARKSSLRSALLGVLNEFNAAMQQQQAISNAGSNAGAVVSISSSGATVSNSGNTSSSTSDHIEKCKDCGGNGKCSGGTKPSSRYHCHGSKKCGYCQGDGFIISAGNQITCSRCKGKEPRGKNKCTYCNGTGKCSTCGGSGKL